MSAAEWKAEDHPRVELGRFGESGGGGGKADRDRKYAERKERKRAVRERKEAARAEEKAKLEKLANRTPGEIRGRLDAQSAVSIESADIQGMPKGAGFSNRVAERLEKKNVFGKHENSDTGWKDVEFDKRSVVRVMVHNSEAGKAALMEQAPKLIEQGTYLETTRINNEGLDSHVFAVKATIDGTEHLVGFSVRQDFNGKRYYNHEMKTMAEAKQWRRGDGFTPQYGKNGKESIMSIVRRKLSV